MKVTRRKATWLLFTGLAGTAGFFGWRVLIPPEPAYHGKTLSAWVRQYGTNSYSVAMGAERAAAEAQHAIRQLGPDTLPFLLRQLRTHDTSVRKKLRAAMPRKWHDRLGLRDQSAEFQSLAANGIHALGTNAAPAAPALIEIASSHPDEYGRYIAVYALRKLAPVAEPVVPFLIGCLTNADSRISDEAVLALGGVPDRPEVVVPPLIRYLQTAKTSSHTYECRDTVGVLGKFGTNAKAASPILVELLQHSSADVRSEVSNSLPLIDAEAAAEAHIQRPRWIP